MTGRPRRSAAQRANEAITDMAETSERMSSRSERRSGRVSRGPPSSPDHLNLNIKVSSKGLRQATSGGGTTTVGKDGVRTRDQISVNSRDHFEPGEIVTGKRNRGVKKTYVVESSEEEDEDAEGDEDEEMEDPGDEDAEGDEDEMEMDAEGEDDDLVEEDAEGDVDMDVAPPPPTIKISKPGKISRAKPAPKPKPAPPSKAYDDDDDDDDDELSDLEPSEVEETITYGNATLGDDDAEGEEEEIEVAGDEDDMEEEDEVEEGVEAEEEQDAEGEEDDALESEDESPEAGSRAETPDLSKMTRRQRARFEDTPQEYMKLSDEVQVKKVFTAEEHAMRRAEMARRRRNLSDKRNEEVKMETINKLLKKQAPKTKGRALAGDETPDEGRKPDPSMYRWISDKNGSRLALPDEMLAGHPGAVIRGLPPGKMIEEVL